MCLFGAARAQTPSDAESPAGDPRFYGGARLSVTMSDVSSVQEHDPRFGVGGGLFVAGTVWKSFDLRVEANYVQKGARLAFSRSAIEWQMDYLEIPVLLVWNIIPKSKTSVELYGGMSYGIPVQQQVEQGENLGYDIEDFTEQPIFINQNTVLQINDVEDTDLGFALGIGLSVPVGQVNFLVDARLTRSITDPVVAADFVTTIGEDEEAVTTTTVTDFSNRLFSFYIGFSFPFGARAPAGSE
ncbi:MAG TPA: porin family protein [Candidatus Krumholzibacteria bacterium]|nr:porin family protein [Candidatus Krumholzibacteria bacterium]